MPLNGLITAVADRPEISRSLADLSSPQRNAGLTLRRGARPAVLAALWQRWGRTVFVLTPRPEDARQLHEQLLTYLGDDAPVYLLPESEVLPFERLAVDAHTGNQRLVALAALAGAASGQPQPLVVASLSAASRRTLSPSLLAPPESPGPTLLQSGQRIPNVEAMLSHWVDLGYRHEPVVQSPGRFTQRGGIIDLFPPDRDLPVRIELWDDEIDTIRSFDPYTQRSVEPLESIRLMPAREHLPSLAERTKVDAVIESLDWDRCSQEVRERFRQDFVDLFGDPDLETLYFYSGLLNRTHIFDYFPGDALFVADRIDQIRTEGEEQEEKHFRMRSSREQRGELPGNFPSPYFPWSDFVSRLDQWKGSRLDIAGWLTGEGDPTFSAAPPYYGQLDEFTSSLRSTQQATIIVSHHSRGRIAEILEQAGLNPAPSDALETGSPPQPGCIYLVNGTLAEGWELPATNAQPGITLFSDAELFGTSKERRRRPPRHLHDVSNDVNLADLEPGSFVVHIDHGVARFTGTTRMGDEGDDREYLVLEYAENDRLYVPTDHLDRVGAYVGPTGQPPTLTRLGTAEWSRVKERVKGAAREIAQELIHLYAARQVSQGHEYGEDTVWQRELEQSFPYQETPDQVQAIDEVKNDMEEPKPMDRLVCGDVGYGKTEVALRAAFKAVADGMQVGVLVPTTVLAQQHYATFSERLSPFPISIEVLSRFRTAREQQEVVSGLQKGSVDVVIGTHRLLQKDVSFKNLGLVVVDEEQRFGVAHKETLKRMRREVDVLTLTATPIPRTLHMALSGIRDMSVIHTPPEARLPVKTFVAEYDDDVIREAILREMERGGQVFFLHNRVRTIDQTAAELTELVPQARVIVGHGQMPEAELEDVMDAFGNNEADVLVCTTIIESGLDMPNVNTIIIDRADRFGLSQLYQLRGRVGRGEHRAYAYLLVPRDQRITETAEKRIEAILEASELGSGFRVAMRDMEIRGAGNLLGAAQSGQIHSVGLSLYGQLLQEAVRELAAEQDSVPLPVPGEPVELPRIELPMPSNIPESYVEHLPTRLALYQRLAQVTGRAQVKEIEEELRDRFGPLPETVERLLQLVDLKALAATVDVESIAQSAEGITVHFRNPVGSARVALQRALGPSVNVGNLRLTISQRELGDNWLSRLTRILERLRVFRSRLQTAAV